jgi:hypothetical protein
MTSGSVAYKLTILCSIHYTTSYVTFWITVKRDSDKTFCILCISVCAFVCYSLMNPCGRGGVDWPEIW